MTDKRDFLPFALPASARGDRQGRRSLLGWITMGPKVKRFEEDIAEFLGDGIETVAVSSATAGLHLALEAVGVGPGDEVITTPYTFTATGEVIQSVDRKKGVMKVNRKEGLWEEDDEV
jgi:dTDP-4-amino-4,6-dideoxygalactose transaminase